MKSIVFNFISGEKLELLVRQQANDGVETLLDESPTAAPRENSEIKTTDFVKLNDGNLQNERDIEVVHVRYRVF